MKNLGITLLTFMALSGCDSADDSNQMNASSPQVGAVVAGNSNARAQPLSCSDYDMKSWVRHNMLDYYLFSDRVDSNIDITTLTSAEAVTRALRVQPEDGFSYMAPESVYNAFFDEGQVYGYGWNLAPVSADSWFFSLIDVGSPLALAGAKRGDQLLAINNRTIDSNFAPGSMDFSVEAFPADADATIDMRIRNSEGSEVTLQVKRAEYTLQTVLKADVIAHGTLKVGYLAFYQFLQPSISELDAAFAAFAAEGIDELVLDLRFNGGDIFARFAYNNSYQSKNFDVNYKTKSNAPSLGRVFVLQGNRTCSASELVVNSLRAHMEVITVGDTSCGKPYATIANAACSKVLNALEIEILNADNAGGYFNGIGADCPREDNLSIPLGSPSEALLETALGYIDNASCSTTAFGPLQADPSQYLRKPDPLKPAWQGGNLM